MSYARFKSVDRARRDGGEPSDVYIYLDVDGFLNCCGCNLDVRGPFSDHRFYSTADMVLHLHKHIARGHIVPARAFERLRTDAAENDAWIRQWRPRS